MTNVETTPVAESLTMLAMNELYSRYDIDNVASLRTVHSVDLPHREGESLNYVRVNEGAGQRAVYIPGFNEGIQAKASFGVALAESAPDAGLDALDVIIPAQNRTGIDRKGKGLFGKKEKKNATHSQALNYYELLEQTRVDEEPVTVITHSYGSLVLQSMMQIAKERESNIFKDANIIMLAPAGMSKKENIFKLGYRFAKTMAQERKASKDIRDVDKSMDKAGVKNLLANPIRSWREARRLAKERLAPEDMLKSGIGSLAIVGYGKDSLYSHDQIGETAQELLDASADHNVLVNYLTPVRFGKKAEDGTDMAPQAGSTHNDEQFNPDRVAHAVREHLMLVEESKTAVKNAKEKAA